MSEGIQDLFQAKNPQEFMNRASTEAQRRGHGQRTLYAGAGGLLGAILGSFFGRSGAGIGGLLGGLLGAFFGAKRDGTAGALPAPRMQHLPTRRVEVMPMRRQPMSVEQRVDHAVEDYIDVVWRS